MSEAHYANISTSYEEALFYAPGPYNDWLANCVVGALALAEDQRLADLGGGTGSFTELVVGRAPRGVHAVVVEPSREMVCKAKERGLATEALDAEGFASAQHGEEVSLFDRILLKEVVHHLKDRVAIFSGLKQRLHEGGSVLIVTRPKHVHNFPLFEAAYAQWAEGQPDATEVVEELLTAGFATASVLDAVNGHETVYPCTITMADWLAFIRRRGWSNFAAFDDSALEKGCEEVAALAVGEESASGVHYDGETLRFKDRLVFIRATRA